MALSGKSNAGVMHAGRLAQSLSHVCEKLDCFLPRASPTGCGGGGAGPALLHTANSGMNFQLAPARAIRSSKALCRSFLCTNKTSLMSFSSNPISLNWLISWRSSVIWKTQTVHYLQENRGSVLGGGLAQSQCSTTGHPTAGIPPPQVQPIPVVFGESPLPAEPAALWVL